MSTRYGEDEIDPWEWVRFQGAVSSGLRGKRGQALMVQLRDALLAMPTHELASGVIAKEGAVCAIGCLGAYQLTQEGVSWENAVRLVSTYTENDEYEMGEDDTREFGIACGFPRAVAWEVGWINDQVLGRLTPAARWQAVYDWVESCLAHPKHARSLSTWS